MWTDADEISRNRYFLTLIHDYSWFVITMRIKSKTKVSHANADYVVAMRNSCDKKSVMISSDKGIEYISKNLQDFLRREEKTSQHTVTYAQRRNWTLTETIK